MLEEFQSKAIHFTITNARISRGISSGAILGKCNALEEDKAVHAVGRPSGIVVLGDDAKFSVENESEHKKKKVEKRKKRV